MPFWLVQPRQRTLLPHRLCRDRMRSLKLTGKGSLSKHTGSVGAPASARDTKRCGNTHSSPFASTRDNNNGEGLMAGTEFVLYASCCLPKQSNEARTFGPGTYVSWEPQNFMRASPHLAVGSGVQACCWYSSKEADRPDFSALQVVQQLKTYFI